MHVRGVSVWAPGLPGWDAARPVLAGTQPYLSAELAVPAPTLLSPVERRRTGRVTRLALAAAGQAVAASGLPAAGLRSVFGSGNGDAATVSAILEALSQPGGAVSPTQFHNSVHNAPAGYWSIGNASTAPSISVGAFDCTFAAALLAAAAEARSSAAPVLLVVYDAEMPAPLEQVRPTPAAFAASLVLAPTGDGPRLTLEHRPDPGETVPNDPALHALFHANPAARALPLLQCLAAGRDAGLGVAFLGGHLALNLRH